MIEYPSINDSSKAPRKSMIAFEKLDGSNIRVKYTNKRGFCLFGSRSKLIDETDELLGSVIDVFNKTCKDELEELFKKYYSNEKEIIVFGEYKGPNSFAGNHSDPVELMKFTPFDIMLIRKSYTEFLLPQEFIKIMSNTNIEIPKIVYEGNLSDDFIRRVRADEFNTFEGVVCKGTERLGSYRGKVWMSKIKTLKYLDLLKLRKGSDFNKFWE